jgi:hypothetical protein
MTKFPDIHEGYPGADSIAIIQNYINKWAKKELVFQKAEENLSHREIKAMKLNSQLEETKGKSY